MPERLISLPELARLRGGNRKTLWKTLKALAEADRKECGQCDWLWSLGPRRKLWVNLARLAVAHPVLFHKTYVGRDEFEGLSDRVAVLEESQRDLKKRTNAIAGSVRDVRGELGQRKAG